jgi:phthiodiolone/phenolphthiodiolone dimycocerosates ketoreductase
MSDPAKVTLGVPGQFMPPASRTAELARRAEADGFDAMWFPCHLMGWHPDSVWTEEFTPIAAMQSNPHMYYDPFQAMAVAGAATERLRVGVGVTDVLRRHPAMLAQSALTAQHYAGGRAILGLGSGETLNVEPYGLEFTKPVGKLAEAIEVIKLLWGTTDPVTFHGDFFRLEDAILGLEPLDGVPPPIWLASHGPRMLELCGREADGWLPTKSTPEEYADRLTVIRRSAEEAGRDPDAITPSMLGYVLCAPDEETLTRMTEHPLVRMLCVLLPAHVYERHGATPPFTSGSGFHGFIPTRVDRAEAERVIAHIPPEIVRYATFHGDAAQIVEQARAYTDAGLRDLVLWNVTGFADPALAGYSFKVLRQVKALLDGVGAAA